MAVRYYLSTLIVDVTEDGLPWHRPAIRAVLTSGYTVEDARADDTDATGRVLVWADVTDAQHAAIVALAGVTAIPFEDSSGAALALTDTIGMIAPASKRNALRTRLEAAGVDTDDLTNSDLLGTVLLRIKRRFKLRNALLRELDFTEGLDTTIGQIPVARRTNITSRLQARGFDTTGILLSDTIRVALRKLFVQNRDILRTNIG